MTEFRKDPVRNQWVVIDDLRPFEPTAEPAWPPDLPGRDPDCPFCPGAEHRTPGELLRYNVIPKEDGEWDVRVFPNRLPLLRVETELKKAGIGMYDWMSGVGADEIIVDSPDHRDQPDRISINRMEQVFWACHDRMQDLKRDTRLKYTLITKAVGAGAGGTLVHPHTRLLATPFVPAMVEEELWAAERYYQLKERCVLCDMVSQETASGTRIVAAGDDAVVLCPYASRHPFEMWVLPVRHASHFELSGKRVHIGLAEMTVQAFRRLVTVLGPVPFVFSLHTSPLQEAELEWFHWHWELVPVLSFAGGPARGAGLFRNPVPPEEAAAMLREPGV